jgi:putative acyl-CoA dehydrogenase
MTEPVRYVQTTHEVANQALPLENYDAYGCDAALREGIEREGGAWVAQQVAPYGAVAGSADTIALAFQANKHLPELRTHDRFGHRIDEVDYHPAYHELMRRAMAHEVHSIAWNRAGAGAHVAHAALVYLHQQIDAGTGCPLTMTHACVPSLRLQPELSAQWVPKVLASVYDGRFIPAADKHSVTLGMAMTEKQGGSDVRANSTRAKPLSQSGPGCDYELTGHKWFCSAPMSDAFLTLAQTERGLSCFLVPRWWKDGSRNRFFIQRLKDKLGNRSNASSEIEYDRTLATLIGEEGRGVVTIIPMVAQTRLDCAAGSAGLMRQALIQALFHARHRSAFGRPLIEQPLMINLLADLALEAEAALVLSLRVARSFDHPEQESERLFARVTTAVAKYWVTRRAPRFAFEAMECLGGAGYVEESMLPRLYREAPLNSIWEGSGNIQCLDVLRTMIKEPAALEVVLLELEEARGRDRQFDVHLEQLKAAARTFDRPDSETSARRWVEDLALALSASLLLRHAPAAVAEAYCAARLGAQRRLEYGGLPDSAQLRALVERALPAGS